MAGSRQRNLRTEQRGKRDVEEDRASERSKLQIPETEN